MTVHVDTDGLRCMAAQCDAHASTVDAAAATPPSVPSSGVQATAAVVTGLHSLATITGNFLGTRLVATSVVAGAAAAAFDDSEATNTNQIGGVS